MDRIQPPQQPSFFEEPGRPRPDVEATIGGVLRRLDPALEARVEKAKHQWGQTVRDVLRGETGLRHLGLNDDARAVQVQIKPGFPESLKQVLRRDPDPRLWELRLHRDLLQTTSQGLRLLADRHQEMVPPPVAASRRVQVPEDFTKIKSVIDRLLEALEHDQVPVVLGELRDDVLGCYFSNAPRVELYWTAVALLAGAYRVSVEGLTVVALAHELAHAYTHVGRDLDGEVWDSKVFATTEREIKEGLAQYYTAAVTAHLRAKLPEADHAYRTMLERQSGPYRVHLDWRERRIDSGEAVRQAMRMARRKQITGYEDFLVELERAAGA